MSLYSPGRNDVYTNPAEDEYAHQCLKLWGLKDRAYGPRAYPNHSAFVPVAHGMSVEWDDKTVELVGAVVSNLHPEHRELVRAFYVPRADGKQCNVSAVCKQFGIHRQKLFEACDRCVGRVVQAIYQHENQVI